MIYLKYIRKNNVLEFSDKTKMEFIIRHDEIGYYANCFSTPFFITGIDKVKLSKKYLGYDKEGNFPYCKTKEDIFKLLRGLQKESKIKYYQENEL